MSKFDPKKVLLDIKSLFGNSPSEIDQHASPRNIAEYAKALAAVFSIATLHVLFFWLNLNFVLWPLIDLSFLLNVTFSFGLFLALGLASVPWGNRIFHPPSSPNSAVGCPLFVI